MQERKTEKEKMLAGALYDATDPQLAEERKAARILLEAFNGSSVSRPGLRRKILSRLLPHAAADIWLEPPSGRFCGGQSLPGDTDLVRNIVKCNKPIVLCS